MNTNTDNPLDQIVHHVLNTRYEDLPAATVKNVKTFLLDTIGVAMAGTAGAGIEDLISVAETWGDSKESSVWYFRLPRPLSSMLIKYIAWNLTACMRARYCTPWQRSWAH